MKSIKIFYLFDAERFLWGGGIRVVYGMSNGQMKGLGN